MHADSNVFALFEFSVAGNPLRLVNLRKANKNVSVLNPRVSKCSARIDAHVSNKIYTLNVPFSFDSSSRTYKNPAKSSPTCVNGESSETLSLERSSNTAPL